MGTIRKDFKFKKIKNFLNATEINLLKDYCKIRHRINIDSKDTHVATLDTAFYGDPIMEALMLSKKTLVEKEVGLELLPTYTYWRLYTINATLEKHVDRESCEISITTMIDSDVKSNWPIYIDKVPVNIDVGDAIVYLGCEVEHWRDKLTSDYQTQVFMHYVNKNGDNKDFFKDKRRLYGQPQVIK